MPTVRGTSSLSGPAREQAQKLRRGACLEAVARRLASDLEDWIAESGCGWGQQRQARYTLPSWGRFLLG